MLLGRGRAVVTALGRVGAMVVSWSPQTAATSTRVRKLDDPLLSDVWGDHLTRLSIDVEDAPSGRPTVEAMAIVQRCEARGLDDPEQPIHRIVISPLLRVRASSAQPRSRT